MLLFGGLRDLDEGGCAVGIGHLLLLLFDDLYLVYLWVGQISRCSHVGIWNRVHVAEIFAAVCHVRIQIAGWYDVRLVLAVAGVLDWKHALVVWDRAVIRVLVVLDPIRPYGRRTLDQLLAIIADLLCVSYHILSCIIPIQI